MANPKEPARFPMNDRFHTDTSFAFPRISARIPEHHKFEDTLRPEYWSSIAFKLKGDPRMRTNDYTGAIIEVRTDDHAFMAELYVRGVMDNGLIVSCIGPLQDDTGKACAVNIATGEPWAGREEDKPVGGLIAKWNFGKKCFEVHRISDNAMVSTGHKTKELAQKWIANMPEAA